MAITYLRDLNDENNESKRGVIYFSPFKNVWLNRLLDLVINIGFMLLGYLVAHLTCSYM